jgi:hypothetical protein
MRSVVSFRLQASAFEEIRAKASELGETFGCEFWWKPCLDDQYDFIFTNPNVAILFRGVLATRGIINDQPEPDILEEMEKAQRIIDDLPAPEPTPRPRGSRR